MVQLAGEAVVDTGAINDRSGLADTLPGDPGHVWIRVHAGLQEKITVDGRCAIRH